jgi:sugar phosphate isomerase/epimerase
MNKPGLVSITFRKLSVEQIIDLSIKAGIEGIEWGGDIHVPHGDIKQAEYVGERTRTARLAVAAYGSYFRFDSDGCTFKEILKTAVALGAPLIRVWAGKKNSEEADRSYYEKIVREARTAGELCAKAGVTLAFEYHGNTLTDTNLSARNFIRDINHPSVSSYWQPPVGMKSRDCLEGINLIKDHLTWVHVFHWGNDSGTRFLLSQGVEQWRDYIGKIPPAEGIRWFLIEFVKDDSPENFLDDAKTLKSLLKIEKK